MPADPSDKTRSDDEAAARQKTSGTEDKNALKPTEEKVPEGEGNLRRRAEWFQKRTGQRP